MKARTSAFVVVFLLFVSHVHSDGFGINCELSARHPLAGEELVVTFQVFPWDAPRNLTKWGELLESHTRKFHVIIIGADFDFMAHVHPDDHDTISKDATSWSVSFVPNKAGQYVIAADFVTEGGSHWANGEPAYNNGWEQGSQSCLIEVEGSPKQQNTQETIPSSLVWKTVPKTGNSEAYSQPVIFSELVLGGSNDTGISVEFSPNMGDSIDINQCVYLMWTFLHADGEGVTSMTPFLGAALHVAIVHQELWYIGTSRIFHIHGQAVMNHTMESAPNCTAGGHRHVMGNFSMPEVPDYFGPQIHATSFFPWDGKYFVFTEGELDNNTMIFTRFTVEISTQDNKSPIPSFHMSTMEEELYYKTIPNPGTKLQFAFGAWAAISLILIVS